MSCNFPMAARLTGDGWKIIGKWTDNIDYVYLNNSVESRLLKKVPCGQCIGCRLDKSRQWADRMLLELQYHDESYFVTLTYDDDHVPFSYSCDDNGEVLNSVISLRKKDLQDFIKRLRYYQGDNKIRYYCCGEYGSSTLRPHYHCIIFGLHLTDLLPFGKNELGQQYFVSDYLCSIWSNGFVSVAEVNWSTCAYVARYVTKKLTGKLGDIYEFSGIEPEFSVMSRRPGIGRQYFDDHIDDLFKFDSIYIPTPTGGKELRPPKYYDRLYDLYCPEDFMKIAADRDYKSKCAAKLRDGLSDLHFEERSVILDRNVNDRVNKLKRSLK